MLIKIDGGNDSRNNNQYTGKQKLSSMQTGETVQTHDNSKYQDDSQAQG